MNRIVHIRQSVSVAILAVVALSVFALPATAADDGAALRRKCAHLIKVKLGIKETGSSNDLKGVPNAVAMVNRCVANKGKLD